MGQVFVALSNGNGFDRTKAYNIHHGLTVGKGGWSSNGKYPRMLADVNGDGKADIVGFGHNQVFVALSNGNGFDKTKAYNIHHGLTVGKGGWSSNDKNPRMLADVNGDGKADIVGFGYNQVFVALSNENGFDKTKAYNIHHGLTVGKGGWSSNDKYPRML